MKKINGFWVPDADTYFAKHLTHRGFQIEHLDLAIAQVTNFGVAIDGGAHIGTWTIEMAKHFAMVHSFEANTETFACLRQNVIDKGIVNQKSFKAALGEKLQKTNLCEDVKRTGNTGSHYVQPCKNGDIDMLTIDSLNLNDVGLLKLDIEGYEYFALQGALQTIKKCKPIIIVECKEFNERYPITKHESLNLLQACGATLVTKIGNDYIYKLCE